MAKRPGGWWRLWIGATVVWGVAVLVFFISTPIRVNPYMWNEPQFKNATPADRVAVESYLRRTSVVGGVAAWVVPPVAVLGLTLLTLTLKRRFRSKEALA